MNRATDELRYMMGKLINLTDQRFGFWIVIKLIGKNKSGQTEWLCQCDCGTQKNVTTNSLRTGNSTSCGCNHAPNLINEKFGNLLVLSRDTAKNTGRRYWVCRCDCGKKVSVSSYQLRNNITTSCGCNGVA